MLASQERTFLRIRIGVLAFGLVDTGLGLWLGGSSRLDLLPLVPLAWVCAVVALDLHGRPSVRELHALGWFAMVGDAAVVATLMAAYGGQIDSSIFLLAVILPLEAALRWPRRGGVFGGAVAGLLTVGWSLYREAHFGYSSDVSTFTFRFGMMVVLGVLAGAALRRLELRARLLHRTLEVSRDLIAVLSLDGTIRSVNPAAAEILGYEPEELVGRKYLELVASEVDPDGLAKMAEGPLHDRVEQLVRHRDGSEVYLEVDITLVPAEGVAYCVARDTSERRRIENALRASEVRSREAAERYLSLFDRNPDAVFSQDLTGHFLSANQACADLVGYWQEELLDPSFDGAILSADPSQTAPYFGRAVSGEALDFETRVRHREGHFIDVHLTYVPIVVEGEVVGVFGVAKDISQRRRLERQLSHQAFHDTLTGLPNRALFLDRLGHALARNSAEPGRCAVLFLDLDHFKLVNDSLGHHFGDRLLQDVAERLTAALSPSHTISRFGGDEFTVLLEDLPSPDEADGYAEALLSALERPFNLSGQEVFCTASIGIAVAHRATDGPDDLLRRADSAMYSAKERGRGRYATFDSGMHTRAVARLTLETQLRRAVERNEFELYYQPEVSLVDGRLVGVEALLRWHHPELGTLAPGAFLQEAAEVHLAEPIGAWVIEQACRQLMVWSKSPSMPPISVNVNLSAPELVRPELVEHVAMSMARHDVAPHRLILEITESVLMDDPEAVLEILVRLKELGVGLAIDDFGTGYSSLAYLQRFPVDVIKIDRAFIDGLDGDTGKQAIVSAVLGLARALNLVTVAEGVECSAQLARLAALGCELGQGYLFCRPGTAEQIGAFASAGPWALPTARRNGRAPTDQGLRAQNRMRLKA